MYDRPLSYLNEQLYVCGGLQGYGTIHFYNYFLYFSAGVGRTGAFIVIDSMLERLQHEKTVDVYGHVTCLREDLDYLVSPDLRYGGGG